MSGPSGADQILKQIAEKPELERKLAQGLKIQAQLKARQKSYEAEATKETDAIKSLEAEISARRQVHRNLTTDYKAEIAEMKTDSDYCEDSEIAELTNQLARLTTSMDSLRTALYK